MPIYEYYCRTCNQSFTQRRPMSDASEGSQCELGHRADKVLTAAMVTVAGQTSPDLDAMPEPSGGGCACGRGSCGCGANALN